MAIQGVDYSRSRPSPSCLYTEGKRFAVRYTNLGAAREKTITLAEAKKLTDAGLRIVTVFEETAGHMLGGAAAGTAAAKASWALGKAAGMHPDAPHFFALDVDPSPWSGTQWATAASYLDAAAAVLGKDRVGLYGNDEAIDKLRAHCTFYWQTYAWSGGRWASGLHLRQYKNGVILCGGELDLDDAPGPTYYGQWGVSVAMASDLQRAQDLARSCDPIPYRMTVEIDRNGIDCSGFMSLLCNSLRGLANPWVRLFATGNIAGLVANGSLPFLHTGMGDTGDFNIGVMYPSESSSGIGHMAGTLGGLNVESRGGAGVLLGADARGATNSLFNHHFHMKIDSTGNVGGSDDMSAADVAAVNAHTTDMMKQTVRYVDHGDPDTGFQGHTTQKIRAEIAELAVLLKGQADDETKILAAIAAAKTNPTTLAAAIVAGLKAEGVITADVDEAAVAAIVGQRVVDALHQVTFTATN